MLTIEYFDFLEIKYANVQFFYADFFVTLLYKNKFCSEDVLDDVNYIFAKQQTNSDFTHFKQFSMKMFQFFGLFF